MDSFDVPQNSAPARFSGSKYLTAGFSFCASDWRSAFVSEMVVVDDARPTGAGAKAAAEPRMAERRASFIIVVGVCCIQENFGLALFSLLPLDTMIASLASPRVPRQNQKRFVIRHIFKSGEHVLAVFHVGAK